MSHQDMLDRAGQRLFEHLNREGITIAFAESLTAGLAASTLAGNPGSSAVLRGGIVAYHNDIKASLLGVDLGHADKVHGVSQRVAEEMAAGVRHHLQADLGVAFTGFATPVEEWGEAECGDQHAWVAISVNGRPPWAERVYFPQEEQRNTFRMMLVVHAFHKLTDDRGLTRELLG